MAVSAKRLLSQPWVPWAVGAIVVGAGAFLFLRSRSGGQATQAAQPLNAPPSVNVVPVPYPTGTIPANASNISSQQVMSAFSSSPPDKTVYSAPTSSWVPPWSGLFGS